ncbi:hypothetical protein [Nonlabens xiamenensis]|uniref:hypothetical protein n=1 Tax=Nonlabens xiamenensis TaxID=2341043 RepID=UPI000F605527|nr:hypothetical protein [Nonlabens xiamenensis]
MKKSLPILLIICWLFSACGVKNTQRAIDDGNYDQAINRAIDNLRGNKTTKRKRDYVLLLQHAYLKAVEEDERQLDRSRADTNPNVLQARYDLLVNLRDRQDRIRPLLPLTDVKNGKKLSFPMKDYTRELLGARNQLSNHYVNQARLQLPTADKFAAREIHQDLKYVDQINPGYQDVNSLMEEAQRIGTTFIKARISNHSGQVIPQELEQFMLNFSDYGLNDPWKQFYTDSLPGISPDYLLDLDFTDIALSPERFSEREIYKEKNIVVGKENLKDKNGNVVKDSLGNPIKVDKTKLVRARIYENIQTKEAQVTASVNMWNTQTNQVLERFPLQNLFVFEHIYGTIEGDRRAIDDGYIRTFGPAAVPYPTDDQMIYDCAEELKADLKRILNRLKV